MPARSESRSPRTDAPEAARIRSSLKTRAYRELKAMILDGRLRPGQKLGERDLGAALKVSRTPVREALNLLAQEGLVEARPQRGHVVADADAKTAADLYDLREVLELEAIRLAMRRMEPADLAGFERLAKRLTRYDGKPTQTEAELREAQTLHELIARASRNELLLEMLLRLWDRLQLFVWIDSLTDEAARTRAEHADIIAAIRADDEPRVLKLMAQHLRRSKANVLRALRGQRG